MAGQKTIKSTYIPPPTPPIPPPVADYHVTGVITPLVTGNYFFEGTHGGQPYYKHVTLEFYIFWNVDAVAWWIANAPDDELQNYFYREELSIAGEYVRGGAYTGFPTVVSGPA